MGIEEGEKKEMESQRVLMVSYRLPSETTDGNAKLNNSCVAAAGRHLRKKGHSVVWIGHEGPSPSPGASSPLTSSTPEVEVEAIFLDPKVSRGWYDYCKTVLFPLFHYYSHGTLDVPEQWKDYVEANETFAQRISEIYQEKDFVLIQDYHLMLLPSLLRKKLGSQASISFFCHIPWPSSELYRGLPVRLEVLQGLLGANLLGFQTYAFVKHFISACTRLLGLSACDKGLWTEDERLVRCDVFPAGIDAEYTTRILGEESVKKRIYDLRESFKGQKMIVSNDRIEYTEGIPHKLRAFEKFLTNFPDWKGKVQLTLCCSGNAAIMAEKSYQSLQEEIEHQVGAINGKFGTVTWNPVNYLNKALADEEIYAIFGAADAGLWTPLRDGMNLTCHEFVCAQQELMSPLIMSEFAGSAQCLSGMILVNPWDDKRVAKAILKALQMTDDQKKVRFKHCYDYVKTNNSAFWIESLLNELKNVVKDRPQVDEMIPPKADMEQITKTFGESQKRLILLDYDGTLSALCSSPEQAAPTTALLALLTKLSEMENTFVYVISGRDRGSLGDWLGHLNIGMSCEHGLFFRPYQKGAIAEWQDIIETLDVNWKADINAIFKDFTDRTPGSMIESKEVNLTWHYRNADPDFGEYQKNELLMHLQDLPGMPIDILPGKKAVEVRPQGINKGSVVRRILGLHPETDFVICMGDDKTDEDMFVEVDKSEAKNHYTIMVEKKATNANYYIDEQKDVLTFLQMFAERS